MTAGVAGGVAGAVVAKLVFKRGGAFSLFEGENERSIKSGGYGNCDSENVEGVVCAPAADTFSIDEAGVVGKGSREVTAVAEV